MGYIELNGTKFFDLNDSCLRELHNILAKNGVFEAKYILEKMHVKDIANTEYNFYVKDYQRGYRWSDDEVLSLLEDINDINDQEPYCIQPLVVKKIKCGNKMDFVKTTLIKGYTNLDIQTLENEEYYELIDGQQRLTTLSLILKEKGKYKIHYEFLRAMDDYYISRAQKTINNFFETNKDIDKNQFIEKIKNQVFFIWYEISDDTEQGQSNKIFKNINAGKIELTNAELFRALLLNDENVSDNQNDVKNKIAQFAFEWDKLEQQLRDDDFWYFIADKEYHDKTRIDYLLELCARILQHSQEFKKFEELKKQQNETYVSYDVEKDRYSFNVVKTYIENIQKNKFEAINEIWENYIIKLYDIIYSWYEDNDLYHYIGFLIAIDDKKRNMTSQIVFELCQEVMNNKMTKTELKTKVKEKIFNQVFANFKTENDFSNLEYQNSNSVYNFLLYFNIWTTMHNKKLNGRFPFRLFKLEDWDIEHIKARRLKTLNKNNENDIANIENYIKAPEFVDLFKGRLEELPSLEDKIKEWNKSVDNFPADNDIGNLTLLCSEINRSYGNGFFDEKREEIIKRDQINAYIPICTRNVFLKYYTTQDDGVELNSKLWTKHDKSGYTQALKDCYNEIIIEKELKNEIR